MYVGVLSRGVNTWAGGEEGSKLCVAARLNRYLFCIPKSASPLDLKENLDKVAT